MKTILMLKYINVFLTRNVDCLCRVFTEGLMTCLQGSGVSGCGRRSVTVNSDKLVGVAQECVNLCNDS